MAYVGGPRLRYWAEYIGAACMFGGFVALGVQLFGAPEALGVLLGVFAGGVALAYVLGKWITERDEPHT